MKFDKTDVHLLFTSSTTKSEAELRESFASAPAATGPPGLAPLPALALPTSPSARLPPAGPPGRGLEGPHTLVAALKGVSRMLWRKAGLRPGATKREQRIRLLELLAWYCGKNNLAFEENAKQSYLVNRSRVDGRLHACISQGPSQVAVEVCFSLDATALQKLRNAHLQGKAPLMLWVGPPSSTADLLVRVAQTTGNPSTSWLELAVLTELAQSPK